MSNNVTVTLPLKEYNDMLKRIEKLEKESISRVISKEWVSIAECKYKVNVDEERLLSMINEYRDEHYPLDK
jgi:hypothetical protein